MRRIKRINELLGNKLPKFTTLEDNTNPHSWFHDYEKYIEYEANKSLNSEAALALVNKMSEWSKETHFAGWLMGTEYYIWDNLEKFPEMEELSKLCGGWWIWEDGERFLTREEWIAENKFIEDVINSF